MDDTTGRVTTPGAQDETAARTQEIRDEIAQTRIEMSETIEAIQERLTPANLVAQAGETVKNATTEKVKQMANTAGYAADQVMDTSMGRTIRANPIPAAMIGIGAAWLFMRSRSEPKGGSGRDRYRTGNAYAGGGQNASADFNTSGAYRSDTRDWRVGATSAGAVGTAGYGEYGTTEAGGTSRVPEFGGEMHRYSGDRQASMNVHRVIRDNPLVVGAAAALVGVAIGMSVPESETENRLMGETRDNVIDKARELASDAAEKVQDVAGQAVDAATQGRDAAGRAGDNVGEGGAGSSARGLGNDTGAMGATDLTNTGATAGSTRTPRAGGRRTT